MSKPVLPAYTKRRPSLFWWTLANLLAASFAVASWSICLYVFNFPEKPRNYEILRKLGRLTPITPFAPLEAPEGRGADPQTLLSTFWSKEEEQLRALNLHFRRNYLTNATKAEFVSYIKGRYRVTGCRALSEQDLFHPDLLVQTQATITGPDQPDPTLYPVLVDLLLPSREPLDPGLFPPEAVIRIDQQAHRAAVLHGARLGSPTKPLVKITVTPLSYENWTTPDQTPLSLAPPTDLNLSAPLPVKGARP